MRCAKTHDVGFSPPFYENLKPRTICFNVIGLITSRYLEWKNLGQSLWCKKNAAVKLSADDESTVKSGRERSATSTFSGRILIRKTRKRQRSWPTQRNWHRSVVQRAKFPTRNFSFFYTLTKKWKSVKVSKIFTQEHSLDTQMLGVQ